MKIACTEKHIDTQNINLPLHIYFWLLTVYTYQLAYIQPNLYTVFT